MCQWICNKDTVSTSCSQPMLKTVAIPMQNFCIKLMNWWTDEIDEFYPGQIFYNCTVACETSYSPFLLTLTPSQGQSCIVIWRLLPHYLVPSFFSLIGISLNRSLGYPILSWHSSLTEHQTNTIGIHAAEHGWKTVHNIADCPYFKSWPLVSHDLLI